VAADPALRYTEDDVEARICELWESTDSVDEAIALACDIAGPLYYDRAPPWSRTDAAPGTARKIEEMASRETRRESLYHPFDAPPDTAKHGSRGINGALTSESQQTADDRWGWHRIEEEEARELADLWDQHDEIARRYLRRRTPLSTTEDRRSA